MMKTKPGFVLSLLVVGLLQLAPMAPSFAADTDHGSSSGWSWASNNFLNYQWPNDYHRSNAVERSEFSALESGAGAQGAYRAESWAPWSGWYSNDFLNYQWPNDRYGSGNMARSEFSAFETGTMAKIPSASAANYPMRERGGGFWRNGAGAANPFLSEPTSFD